jgi:hypothetical protein
MFTVYLVTITRSFIAITTVCQEQVRTVSHVEHTRAEQKVPPCSCAPSDGDSMSSEMSQTAATPNNITFQKTVNFVHITLKISNLKFGSVQKHCFFYVFVRRVLGTYKI